MSTASELENETAASLSRDVWEPIPYVVTGKHRENDKLLTLTLSPTGASTINPIQPGQFNMIYAFGVGEIPISTGSLLVPEKSLSHTIQDVGPVSKTLTQISVNDVVGVRGPFGTSWPVEKAKGKDVVIMAGGVGLCPLRPLIESILKERDQFGQVNVLYGTRDPDNIIYHQDMISWQSDPTLNFHITVDHAFSQWRGNVGVVTQLIDKAVFDPENTIVYICGPEVMMRFSAYACLNMRIPENQIYISMERNMKCAFGLCGHCQFGPYFVCKDGAVFPYSSIASYLKVQEL